MHEPDDNNDVEYINIIYLLFYLVNKYFKLIFRCYFFDLQCIYILRNSKIIFGKTYA